MRIRNKMKKFIIALLMLISLLSLFGLAVYAAETTDAVESSGDVAGAVEDTWMEASGQIRRVVDRVVFPIIDVILAVLFFVKIATAYLDYRKHGQFEWAPPAILLATLVFSLTAPHYIWRILGM